MEDDSSDTGDDSIDMGYLVTLPTSAADHVSIRSDLFILLTLARGAAGNQGITLVHFSAQHQPFLTQDTPHIPPDTP